MRKCKTTPFIPLVGLLAFGCVPEDEPDPLTQPGVPVASENGYYELTVEPADGSKKWPDWALGPQDLKAVVRPTYDDAPPDSEVAEKLPAEPPYMLKFRAPLASTDKRGPVPKAVALDAEGRHWALGPLDITLPGYWVLQADISNQEGVVDTAELRFKVE